MNSMIGLLGTIIGAIIALFASYKTTNFHIKNDIAFQLYKNRADVYNDLISWIHRLENEFPIVWVRNKEIPMLKQPFLNIKNFNKLVNDFNGIRTRCFLYASIKMQKHIRDLDIKVRMIYFKAKQTGLPITLDTAEFYKIFSAISFQVKKESFSVFIDKTLKHYMNFKYKEFKLMENTAE